MAIQDVTKPMALDETLQATNTKLQASVDALGAQSVIGNTDISGIADGTLTGAVAEFDTSKLDASEVGVAGGVAELDSNGKVPSSQLPSFVDDVIEGYYYNGSFYVDSAHTQAITPESGKIYVDLDSNKTYRWGGTAYVVISETLALGETSSTAYRGDRGKTAFDHSQDPNRNTSAVTPGLYKIGVTSEGHVSSPTAVQKSDIQALGISAVEASTTNGNIKIDDTETQVYDDTGKQDKLPFTFVINSQDNGIDIIYEEA